MKLKNLFCPLLLVAVTAHATLVQFNSDTNRRLLITADQSPWPPLSVTTNLTHLQFFVQPSANSVITNLPAWGYNYQYDGWAHPVHIIVTNSTSVLNAANLISPNAWSPLSVFNVNPIQPGTNIALVTNSDGSLTISARVPAGLLTNNASGVSLAGTFTGALHGSGGGSVTPDAFGAVVVANGSANAGATVDQFGNASLVGAGGGMVLVDYINGTVTLAGGANTGGGIVVDYTNALHGNLAGGTNINSLYLTNAFVYIAAITKQTNSLGYVTNLVTTLGTNNVITTRTP